MRNKNKDVFSFFEFEMKNHKTLSKLKHVNLKTDMSGDSLPNVPQSLLWLIDFLELSKRKLFFLAQLVILDSIWCLSGCVSYWARFLHKRWELNRVLAHHITAEQVNQIRHRLHLKHCSTHLSEGYKGQVGTFSYLGWARQETDSSYYTII